MGLQFGLGLDEVAADRRLGSLEDDVHAGARHDRAHGGEVVGDRLHLGLEARHRVAHLRAQLQVRHLIGHVGLRLACHAVDRLEEVDLVRVVRVRLVRVRVRVVKVRPRPRARLRVRVRVRLRLRVSS